MTSSHTAAIPVQGADGNTRPTSATPASGGEARHASSGKGGAGSGPPARLDTRDLVVVVLLIISAFVAILNETTMGIAIPHLNADLGLPPELGQWLTSAFMLSMAVIIPITGILLQRFTTRQVYLAAMIAFTVGTLICAIAPGFVVLLAGRVVQALGTGIMLPLLMTTLMNVVPEKNRGLMMGFVGMVISLAPAVGPTVSGIILDNLHWRWVFGLVLPLAIIALVVGAIFMRNLGETRKAPIDVLSIFLSALGFGGAVFGLSQFGSHGGAAEGGDSIGVSPVVLGVTSLVIGVAMLGLFVWRQLALQKRERALLDLRTFRSRNFSIAVVIMAIVALSMFGTLTLLPQYLQNVVQLDSTTSGLVLMPGALLMGVLGPVIGAIYDRVGARVLLVPGTIIIAGSLFCYSMAGAHTPVWMLFAIQTVMSLGLALAFTPLFSSSLGSLEPRLYSHGSASLNTLQQVGGAAGVAVLLAAYSGILHAGEAEGLATPEAGEPAAQAAFFTAFCIALVPVVLAWFVRKPEGTAPIAHGGH
ncbi:MFS transporter [Pseudoclavibacter endophyticus]|uniref:DHA2 family efflux MFS transporter permease subunit n=1 Tax=Pseudoclavibacter endophyticus TaxID=1778590 RepID=A0A6H9WW03_9MICO|nr:DHA2 family efflux MFS transporter permease subunit [Pseudoclavibacter endophyticus]KAB1650340.1 DHA2 family efflux MFS transporter permease subunit [Pseudoclavibacter endophyticus]GGA54989.1 MFS transporter [Pseudoclavibacter endophyticus]